MASSSNNDSGNGDQERDVARANDDSRQGDDWILKLREKSPTSRKGGGKTTQEEIRLMERMQSQETDGLYDIKNSTATRG